MSRSDAHPELPLDSDVEPGLRPAYRRPGLISLVFVGGAVGTLARWGTGLLVPRLGAVPAGTFVANVLGAFVLGLLLEQLAGRGSDDGRRQAVRVALGTGFCGGFTTYSALATESAVLLRSGVPGTALAYAVLTVVVGVAASALGIALGRRWGRA